VGGTRQIQAHFARPLELFAATHLAGHYYSPGTTVLHGQFSLPVDARLQQLTWRPGLPKGWTLRAVSGLGGPRRQGSTVVFEQLVNHNPVQFNLSVEVPAGETDAREIAGNAEFTLAGETASQTQPITPLTLFDESSPAATLALDLAGAHPTLTIRGAVGRTYVIEQTAIEFLPNWAFMGDVTLTNSTQVYLDPFPRLYNGDLIYRASVIE